MKDSKEKRGVLCFIFGIVGGEGVIYSLADPKRYMYQNFGPSLMTIGTDYFGLTDMSKLHIKAGQYIAKLLGVEDAHTTSGAGITLSVAACIVRHRPDRLGKFLHVEDLKHQVIVQKKHRNTYDYIIEIPGAKSCRNCHKNRDNRRRLEKRHQ